MTAISGNTYPVKDALKALGARWNADRKAWMIADSQADEARKIVAGAPASTPPTKKRTHASCHDCGRASRGYYRCWDCAQEYKDGGDMAMGGMSYTDRHGNFVLGADD